MLGVNETEIALCVTCAGTGVLTLPTVDDVDEHPCPTCRPWSRGFAGLHGRHGKVLICFVHPAKPNERAIKHTNEERHESNGK